MDVIDGQYNTVKYIHVDVLNIYYCIHPTHHTGYMECNETSLLEALSTCLSLYNNKGSHQAINLVFHRQIIRHVTRLCRVLVGSV